MKEMILPVSCSFRLDEGFMKLRVRETESLSPEGLRSSLVVPLVQVDAKHELRIAMVMSSYPGNEEPENPRV